VPNLTGGISPVLANHHITEPVMIGEIRAGGQFNGMWQTEGLVPGDAWSHYFEGSKDFEAGWVGKKCGNFNSKTGKCGS
jgi:urea transport system substrate-binding protein